ncbi:hypothetical protein [Clostridium beijerinckii]|uniref:hypothetical protein n=1 Tax=Clostridium beijerinckii TaxID=1520 RepID=UPI00098CD189|nr:hypothetical protein [Clostridium beijerinckii]MBA8933560.1 septation ring formation regulator EzrA [Clostridium beijerinckii]NRU37759.1 septation ring formation regulator EzrA [Clostridium beijerinckii]NSA98963.1 septation ring formation regulator EzrA [Clostridium beijerinckii]OOM55613.1 hypothetical protein CLOBI_44030 [Clostridium beijerinckii]OOM72548.1 hypothetical protein CLBEIC_05570 [Clostridium beijerinckii]
MNFYIFTLVICSIIFLIYALNGVFYILKKPEEIINKKLSKTEKIYEITNVNEYLSNLGKLNLYSAIILYAGVLISLYADKYRYQISMYIYIVIYFAYFYLIRSRLMRKIEKYLIRKDTKISSK